jgi:hypothetical protein
VARSGLAEPVGGSLADLSERTGWPRALGGVDALIALSARRPGLDHAEVTREVEAGRLTVGPAVRNCVHVLPADHHALALAEAGEHWSHSAGREHAAAGIRDGELDEVGDAVLDLLGDAGDLLTTDQLRARLPVGLVRSLGPEGHKYGLSSTLPPALRMLEIRDRVRRRPVDGRIDREHYRWQRTVTPVTDDSPTGVRRARLAGLFARFTGPFTVRDLAAWLSIAQRDARAAVDHAGLAAVEVEGLGTAWIDPADVDDLCSAEVDPRSVHLLGFEDLALVAHQPVAWFDESHHQLRLPVWGRGTHTLGGANHVAMRTVLVGDRMAGFWAWDPDAAAVEVGLLDRLDAAAQAEVGRAAEATTEFLRAGPGHARMTGNDGEGTERARLEALRSMLS